MIINISEYKQLLDLASEMAKNSYMYVTYPVDEISDAYTLTFFKSSWEAAEHCYEMSNDVDFYKSLPTATLIRDLSTVSLTGIDTTENEAVDLLGLANRYRDNVAFLYNNLKQKIMNEKNFDYLKDQVMYTGFGEALQSELKQNMEQLKPEFKLQHDTFYGESRVGAELSFRKSEQSDLYFFNSYKVSLQKEGSEESLDQTFYINKGNNITLKEAYNLMEGRSVNKDLTNREGETYNSWVQLDFKNTDTRGNFMLNHYHENYGFDLEAALSKHPIKELNNPKYKDDLINSLKKGNIQSATFVKDGKETKQFVEANPQFKTVTVYDANQNRLDTKQDKKEEVSQKASNSKSRDVKETPNDQEGPDEKKETSKRRKAQSM
ncbi:hypothetical protein [Flavobacterium sp. fv08]|uniref:hypothetical protein n=1 Tax=Flavobacterium sp. fv08 TaxID=1761784 RepID=UPI0008D3F73E|nr:hypothetical protein [Flavobacterium sp. fv08]SEP07084.1 hypothetical protein SAMN04487978_4383 [Flavobacterium sp. fv08]